MSTPVLDLSRNYGDIFHGEAPPGVAISDLPRYVQDGHYFLPNKTYHSSDAGAKKVTAAPAPVTPPSQVDTLPGVDLDSVEELMNDPRAEQLMALPRDHLIALVNAANGPTYAGEGSSGLMVAWLIANTLGAAPKPRPAPPPVELPTRTIIHEPPQGDADSEIL